jgi:hypothetical protein
MTGVVKIGGYGTKASPSAISGKNLYLKEIHRDVEQPIAPGPV